MSVTTFGDLVTEAEQVLIVLACQREPNAPRVLTSPLRRG